MRSEVVLGQVIAFMACVVVPVGMTAVAPVVTVELERQEDAGCVQARVTAHALFLVPIHRQVLPCLTDVHAEVQLGATRLERNAYVGERVQTTTEDEGMLWLSGRGEQIGAPLAPSALEAATEEAQRFLASTDKRLRLLGVANWLFGVFLPALLLLLLTLPYLLSMALRAMRHITGDRYWPVSERRAAAWTAALEAMAARAGARLRAQAAARERGDDAASGGCREEAGLQFHQAGAEAVGPAQPCPPTERQ